MLDWILSSTPDDAFYYYQLVTGATAWNETNGYHPLWAIILLPLGLVLRGDSFVYAATGVYYSIWLATPIVFHRLYGTKLAYAIWLVPLGFRGAIGMEFPLVVLLSGIAYRTRHPLVIALMILSRLDTALLAAAIAKPREWPKIGLYILPWFVFSYIAVGTIVPDSATHITEVDWYRGLGALLLSYGVLPILAIGVIATRHPALVVITVGMFIIDATRNTIWPWHYVYVPLIFMLALMHIRDCLSPGLAYAAGLVGLAFVITYQPMLRDHYPQHLLMVEVVKRGVEVEGSLGAYNSGIAGFYHKQKVYNLDGIFNHNVQPTDYVLDFELYVEGMTQVQNYGSTTNLILGEYALYRRDH